MLILEGIATSAGISKGITVKIDSHDDTPVIKAIKDTESEHIRVEAAIHRAKTELSELYEKTLSDAGEEVAAIFEIHSTMLEDEDFLAAIFNNIDTESICAEYAVYMTGNQFASMFSGIEDDYMRERAADITDLSKRIIGILTGHRHNPFVGLTEPIIIAAHELLPSQTIQLDKSRVLAFISRKGSMNSHASILARSLGIPAVAGLENGFDQIQSGDYLIVDGMNGLVISEPDNETLDSYEQKLQVLNQETLRLRSLIGTKAMTKDGSLIEICANIGHSDECLQALEMDADGIGLFRSEFLYLESDDFPDEETQFLAYKKVLETLSPKRVVIRTLDLGADKQAPYLQIGEEDNPALGYRAIRICLDRTDIFIPQLRALLRASIYGKLAVMFPMITSLLEVKSIYTLLNTVGKDLKSEGIPYSEDIEYGIMIETPAAVMITDRLAKEVDFFSIGTNDLTQYAMACDRMNSKISYLFDSGSVSILRMIKQTVDAAHQNGIWVGICGESAADPNLLPYYIAMGVDELSVSSPKILMLKENIQSLEKADCIIQCAEYLD
jgi:phosphoenolpyruvate-protein phosphotransferase (PTS system enzyme I)